MHEPSDGIAEELERQLQLLLATAAILARRAVAAREQGIAQAQREHEHATRAGKAQIDAQRVLATARVRPVFDEAWWDTATPQEIADTWQENNSWRDTERGVPPTIFDHAAQRIRQELRNRAGLDPTEVIALAAVQELEHEQQATPANPVAQPPGAGAAKADAPTPQNFDDPQRREQLGARLAAAGVPEAATEARTLADVGQAREPAEALQPPVAVGPEPRQRARRGASRELRRQR